MSTQSVIRNGIQELARRFNQAHHQFLTERDVQCQLYSILFERFNGLQKASLGDERTKTAKEHQRREHKTNRLHAELYQEGTFADIAILPQKNIVLAPNKSQSKEIKAYAEQGKEYPKKLLTIKRYQIRPNGATAIEIKFNWGHYGYYKSMGEVKREKFKEGVKKDIKKLREKYAYRYFIFVDKRGVFTTQNDFKEFMQKIRGKKTHFFHAYYFRPTNQEKIRIHPYRIGFK